MIKLLNQYFSGRLFVLLATENLLILLGIWTALCMHNGTVHVASIWQELFGRALLVTVLCQISLYYNDLYDLKTIGSRLEIFIRLLQALGVACMLLALIYLVLPQLRLRSGLAETAVITMIVLILVWRVVVDWANRVYVANERILLIGAGEASQILIREIQDRNDLPIKVVGVLGETEAQTGTHTLGVPILGSLLNLAAVVDEIKPDRVVVALQERRRNLPVQELVSLRMRGMVIEDANTLFEKVTGKLPVESIHPSWLIFSDGFRKSWFLRAYKRAVALIGAVIGLTVFAPIMVLVAIAIRLDSAGPVLYSQERVGINGKRFHILKFRSMRIDAETSVPTWATENDPRVTRVGRIIRNLRLDEVPQFVNVLRGDMAFVGPRPERPYFVEQLGSQIPFYDQRHIVRPGITGWAQVCCSYGSTVEESKEKLEYDLFYLKNMSISLDLLVIFRTIKIMIFGRGAR